MCVWWVVDPTKFNRDIFFFMIHIIWSGLLWNFLPHAVNLRDPPLWFLALMVRTRLYCPHTIRCFYKHIINCAQRRISFFCLWKSVHSERRRVDRNLSLYKIRAASVVDIYIVSSLNYTWVGPWEYFNNIPSHIFVYATTKYKHEFADYFVEDLKLIFVVELLDPFSKCI